MADAEETIDIVIDDTAEKPEIVIETPTDKAAAPVAAEKKDVEPEEGVRQLKANLEQEKLARLDAEQRARVAGAAELKAKGEVQDTNLSLVTNAIASVKQSTESLKSKYREAMTDGDYGAAADIQADMATNAAKLLQLEQGKLALEAAPKPTSQRHSADPIESAASQLSARSAAWIRAHPEFVTRDGFVDQRAINADSQTKYKPDTDEYFADIERILGISSPAPVQVDNPLSEAASATSSRSPASAPVSRNGGGPGARPNSVRLSKEEVEMAEMMGMDPAEYAKNKVALQREGKLH